MKRMESKIKGYLKKSEEIKEKLIKAKNLSEKDLNKIKKIIELNNDSAQRKLNILNEIRAKKMNKEVKKKFLSILKQGLDLSSSQLDLIFKIIEQ